MPTFGRIFRFTVLAASVAAAVCTISYGQTGENREPIYYLGIFGAYNSNIHSAEFSELPGFKSCCPQFTSGSGSGFAAGVVGELPLADFLRLQTRLAFSSIGGTLTATENIGNTRIRRPAAPFDTITTPVIVQHRVISTLYTIGLEPTAAFNVTAGLFAHVGFSLAYLMNAEADVRETITEPVSATFLDGRAFRNDKTGAIPDASSLLFSGIFGLSYELPVSKGIFLRPDVRYYLPFGNVADVSWKVSTLQIGAGLLFAVYPPEEMKYLRDTVYLRDTASRFTAGIDRERIIRTRSNMQVETIREGSTEIRRVTISENYLHEIPRITQFAVTVSAAGVEPDGSRQAQPTIRIEEIETEEGFPLLPHVFYPEGSGNLTKTGMRMLDPQRAKQFSEEKLPHNTLDIYADMLNVVGSRLKMKPTAKLFITGAANMLGADAKPEVAADRAEQLQWYFEKVWGIEPARIVKKSRGLPEKPATNSMEDGKEENRRAELASDDPDVFRPVTLKEIDRKATPPRIEITPNVQSDTGITRWTSSPSKAVKRYAPIPARAFRAYSRGT